MIETFNKFFEKVKNNYSSLTVAWAIFLALTTWCSPRSSSEIRNKLSDIESEILTRGDEWRNINTEGNIYLEHLWEWDDTQIVKMLEWAKERSAENEEIYNELLEERNEELKELDEAIAREAREARKAKNSESVNSTYNFDENQFMNSDYAIVRSIRNRNN